MNIIDFWTKEWTVWEKFLASKYFDDPKYLEKNIVRLHPYFDFGILLDDLTLEASNKLEDCETEIAKSITLIFNNWSIEIQLLYCIAKSIANRYEIYYPKLKTQSFCEIITENTSFPFYERVCID